MIFYDLNSFLLDKWPTGAIIYKNYLLIVLDLLKACKKGIIMVEPNGGNYD